MTTFNFYHWWAGVRIENLFAKMQLEDWCIESGLTTPDALIKFDFQHHRLELLYGHEQAITIAVTRLGELSHRYLYHASFILNAAFFCIGV